MKKHLHICITESLRYTTETNTTQQVNCTSIEFLKIANLKILKNLLLVYQLFPKRATNIFT